MDTLAHFLWTFALYWQHPKRWWAGLIGILPDLLSFGLFIPYGIIFGVRSSGHMDPSAIPQWVHALYNVTHSLVIFVIVAALFFWLLRDWFWLLGGWLLHILIDIPTHSRAFFPTPLFWPISSVTFNGISWGVAWFMLLNYGALLFVYGWLLWWRRSTPD